MEKYKCKLCFRFFNNGRALGGHMKSHLAKLPIFPREKDESESSSESLENPTRIRSKGVRRPSRAESAIELEPVSSVSNTSPEEDVALSLMMLSRDTWHWVDLFDSVPAQHKCEICDKVFKSSQALGGHRTSHKKEKRDDVAESTRLLTQIKGKKIDKKKSHECPICRKVFGSGQALGGHKRSHFLISPVSNNASSSGNNIIENLSDITSDKFGDNWIDLNMPAPIEDDDEASAVSVAEF